MPKDDARLLREVRRKARLLNELKQKKNTSRPEAVEAALRAWGFEPGKRKGQTQVWAYKGIMLTLHPPHGKSGGNTADPGAVAKAIQKIEEAETLQKKEKELNGGKADVN